MHNLMPWWLARAAEPRKLPMKLKPMVPANMQHPKKNGLLRLTSAPENFMTAAKTGSRASVRFVKLMLLVMLFGLAQTAAAGFTVFYPTNWLLYLHSLLLGLIPAKALADCQATNGQVKNRPFFIHCTKLALQTASVTVLLSAMLLFSDRFLALALCVNGSLVSLLLFVITGTISLFTRKAA